MSARIKTKTQIQKVKWRSTSYHSKILRSVLNFPLRVLLPPPPVLLLLNLMSRSKSNSEVGDEPQSSFHISPVPPHVQLQQQRQEEEVLTLAPSSLDSFTIPLSSSSEGTPISTFDTIDHRPTAPNNEIINHTTMQIHLPLSSAHSILI